ncbi:hypothetical protein D0T66_14145 [Dysgonomonas sp. 25]|nr:hypothetical protein [Dysgonomonas sp. 25]
MKLDVIWVILIIINIILLSSLFNLNIMINTILKVTMVLWPFTLFYCLHQKATIMDKVFFFSYECLKVLDEKSSLFNKPNFLNHTYR